MEKQLNKLNQRLRVSLSIMVLSICTIFLLLSNSATAQTIPTFSGGTGDEGTPYQISKPADLTEMANYVNGTNGYTQNDFSGKYFQMTADIDMTSVTNFAPIGTSARPFKGSFDGNGYIIKAINILQESNTNVGLFGYINSSTSVIKNIGIFSSTITGKNNVGAIAGYVKDFNTISNCFVAYTSVTGKHTNNTTGSYVGGLFGTIGHTTNNNGISYCYGRTNTISGYNYVGGIAGRNSYTTNTGTEEEPNYVTYTSQVHNCYELTSSIGTSIGSEYHCGPIGGQITTNATTDYSYLFYSNEGTNTYTTGSYGTPATETNVISRLIGSNIYVKDVFATTGLTNNIILSMRIASRNIIVIGSGEITNGYSTPMPTSITISDGGSLKDYNNPTIIPDNNITIESKMKVGAWNLWGSVLNGTNTAAVLNNNIGTLNTTHSYDVAAVQYNYVNNDWNSTTYLLSSNTINKGEGYFVYPLNGYRDENNTFQPFTTTGNDYIIVSQHGALNHDANCTVSKTLGGGDYNSAKWVALSNPYMGKLNVEDFVDQASQDEILNGEVVFVYNADNSTWKNNIETNGVSVINPAQGFMVAANTASGNDVVFTINNPASATKKSTKVQHAPFITFASQANNTTKEAFARINEQASNDFDIRDAYVIISTENTELVEPYFLVNDRHILKDEFKTLPYVAPINFHASKTSNTNLTVNNIPENVNVSIIDLSNGTETALENGSTFSFVANQGENEGRFVVKFGKNNVGIDNNAEENNIFLAMYPNPATTSTTLFVDGLTNNAQVFVNDVQGRTINTYTINKNQSTLKINTESLASGVYYIRVVTNNLTKTEKLVVK